MTSGGSSAFTPARSRPDSRSDSSIKEMKPRILPLSALVRNVAARVATPACSLVIPIYGEKNMFGVGSREEFGARGHNV